MKPIKNEVDKIVHNVFKRQNPILAEVMVNWGKIVGGKFNFNSYPHKIITSKDKGKKINILYITSENSSVSMEIAYQQEIILERLAVYLGYKAVHKLRFLVRG